MSAFDDLVTDFLRLHWTYNPVDATFAGVALYDGSLPPADAAAGAREAAALRALATRLDALAVPAESGARLDARSMRARIDHVLAALTVRPRLQNPAWYTGEVAFGIISLLLPGAVERDSHALEARLDAVPDFLAAGAERLKGRAVPADWVTRARAEIAAVRRLLANPSPTTAFQAPAGPLHLPAAPLQPPSAGSVASALAALAHFDDALRDVPDADPACGRDYLALLMRDVHGLAETPEQLERAAQAAFDATLARLDEGAARLDPARSWREQMAALSDIGPEPEGVLASYRAWHDRALRDGASLLTPAGDYALDFALLPEWARAVAADLYFLFYRSPPERAPGSGSVYWVAPPAPADPAATRRAHNTAAVKLVHAVHHGSIGHHTQNARARRAPSRIARMAGTDCASGIALLSAGTLVEGWACYAEDLLAEVPDFYTPAERLQLEYFELRNIACCLADIRLHTGAWDLAAMRRFYRDEVDFAPARIWSETTRNSIFPASRLMYWTGSRAIKALRAASKLNTKDFHDALLGFGSVPVAWISAELLA